MLTRTLLSRSVVARYLPAASDEPSQAVHDVHAGILNVSSVHGAVQAHSSSMQGTAHVKVPTVWGNGHGADSAAIVAQHQG